MKNATAILLVFAILVIGLVGCQSQNDSAPKEPSPHVTGRGVESMPVPPDRSPAEKPMFAAVEVGWLVIGKQG